MTKHINEADADQQAIFAELADALRNLIAEAEEGRHQAHPIESPELVAIGERVSLGRNQIGG